MSRRCGVALKEASASFLKKRSKKLLQTGPQVVSPAWYNLAKVFWLLFFKKVTA
jgi:hypothetical protein